MSNGKAQAGQVRIKLVAPLLVVEARLEHDHGIFDREPFIVLGRMIEASGDCERPMVQPQEFLFGFGPFARFAWKRGDPSRVREAQLRLYREASADIARRQPPPRPRRPRAH
jgi:hypothetical protein